MIYKNFLFFHIPKAGGSSIEKMLLGRHRALDFVIHTIFKDTKFSRWMVGSMRNRDWRRFIFGLVSIFMTDIKNLWGIRGQKVLHHLTYLDIHQKPRTYLKKKKKLSDFVKFCIVRNPYDRMISAYHFLGNKLTFTQFINWVYAELDNYYRHNVEPFVVILPQWEFVINENGANGMDEVLRFENLSMEFEVFKKKYDLPITMTLPHINSRKRSKTLISYYTQELADMVYHMYKWDFKMFGYKRIMLSKSKKEQATEPVLVPIPSSSSCHED
jgi:hypothetical protein